MTRYGDATVQLGLQKRAWYIDRFGMERECIVITGSGFVNGVLVVLDLEGGPLEIDPESVYYVPQEEEGE